MLWKETIHTFRIRVRNQVPVNYFADKHVLTEDRPYV